MNSESVESTLPWATMIPTAEEDDRTGGTYKYHRLSTIWTWREHLGCREIFTKSFFQNLWKCCIKHFNIEYWIITLQLSKKVNKKLLIAIFLRWPANRWRESTILPTHTKPHSLSQSTWNFTADRRENYLADLVSKRNIQMSAENNPRLLRVHFT